ncbi:MAG: hypothetical protein HY874_08395 [Chloroflexi bacterium]|nr:hypothetical protein [Chloroflexota bacterium]
MDAAPALIFFADAATAAAGAFNTAWLAGHWLRGAAPVRRLAAVTLALVNAGIAAQATFAQAMFSAHRFGFSVEPFFGTAPWLAARLPLLAGTLLLSALILRRVR